MAAKKRGSKLNKSETVQVRFDPILKWAAELAAGKERRTLSSLIEYAVERIATQTIVARDEGGNPISAWQVALDCWQANACMQLYMFSKCYPDLLTIRERKITEAWRWVDQFMDGMKGDVAGMVKILLIERGWDDFCRYADDQITLEDVILRLRNLRAAMDKDGTITTVDQTGDHHETHSPNPS